MLKVSGDGRRAALDLRLVGLPQLAPGKIEAAADRIAAIRRAHHDDEYRAHDGTPYPVRGSLQIVFCDLGTPGPGWNVYGELRDQLTQRGLPGGSVRFVHEAKNDTELARLFAACRSGHVAVLVGSTEKMGVGTNVQDRAIALHHLDAPWRPADVAQREGRIVRQGNLNKEVQVIRYLTERSFDGYSWQTLERKARFIRDVMSPALDSRELGDIGDTVLSFSEAKALATNNPLLMDKAEADADLGRLIRAERAHHRNQDTLRRTITWLDKHVTTQAQLATDIDAAIARRQETRGDAFTMTIGDRTYRKRADAGLHLLHILRREAENQLGSRQRIVRAGELGGFPLTVTVSRALGQVEVAPALDGAPGTELRLTSRSLTETDPVGLITRMENRLAQLETTKVKVLTEIDHSRGEIDHATATIGKPFLQAADLAAARQRSRHIDEQLEAAAAPSLSEAESGSSVEQPNAAPPSAAPQEGGRREELDSPASQTVRMPGQPKRARPPWPSATERAAGPTPTRQHSAGATWEPRSLAQRGYAPPRYPDGRTRRYLRSPTEHASEEREADQ